jgi:hypothetical protein
MDGTERRRWAQCWIADVAVKNREVVAILTPPLRAVGFATTEAAPRGRRPQVPEPRVRVEYSLSAYYHAGASGNGDAGALTPETRCTLAPESESESAGVGAEQLSGNGRCRKRGATACSPYS